MGKMHKSTGGNKALRRRNSVVNMFDNSEESKHVAELLQMTGAHKISTTTQLQLAAMQTTKKAARMSAVLRTMKTHRKSAPLEEEGEERQAVGGLHAALAANKMKRMASVRPADVW